MMKAGMNVARLNFSHGTHAEHKALIRHIRSAARSVRMPIAIMQDLQGPKIRLGELPKEGVEIKARQKIIFQTGISAYQKKKVDIFPVTYDRLDKDVKKGDRILIDDGILEVVIEAVKGRQIHAKVKNGGHLSSHKGMNFPDSELSLSSLTKKDKLDLTFGLSEGVDYVAFSFVTQAREVRALRRLIKDQISDKEVMPRIVSKIEKHEAIKNFDDILEASDVIMIARGDLGVEINAEEVPIVQKEIIEKCRIAGRPVIVATQMLDSMIRNPRPTRAEVSDVANAIMDHTDAVMLSGESATGKYPVQAVQMLKKISEETEHSKFDDITLEDIPPDHLDHVVSHTLNLLAKSGQVQAIVSATFLAPWSEQINIARPEAPMYIASDDLRSVHQLNMRWGVYPFFSDKLDAKVFTKKAIAILKKDKKLKKGMRIALVLGEYHGKGFDLVTL